MSVKIVILEGGRHWADAGWVTEVTDEAYARLERGMLPSRLEDADIVSEESIPAAAKETTHVA